MKRLPFALVALSLSIPVVACLNSSSDDEAAVDTNDLSEATTKACNFGFTAVENPVAGPITFPKKSALTPGKRAVFGKFSNDDKTDMLIATATNKVQAYKGDGTGKFALAAEKTVAAFGANRTRTALSTVTAGDFDGDGIQDVVLASTSYPKDGDETDLQVDYRILYGKANGEFALNNQASITPIKEKIVAHVAGDLDGDGADDLAIITKTGQIVSFGEKNAQKMTAGEAFKYENPSERTAAFITKKTDKAPAALVLVTADKVASLSFATKREQAAPTEVALKGYLADDTQAMGDLDQDGTNEIVQIGATTQLAVLSLAGKEPLTFPTLAGRPITALDLDGNAKGEIVYTVADESKVYAACGYAADAKAIGAVELAIPYDRNTFIAGTPDLNGDGKPDFVTMPVGGGDLKVYLASAPLATPPELTLFASSLANAPDSGTPDTGTAADTGTGAADTGTGAADSGTDTGTGTADSGTDSGSTGPGTVDSGTTQPPPKADAGTTTNPDGDDDDDSEVGGDDDDEETGPTKPAPKTKPKTSSSGSVTITPKQPTATSADGCSTAPGTSPVSTSAFAGLFAAMLLLARRRTKKS